MILINDTQTLQVVLAGAVATRQCPIDVGWAEDDGTTLSSDSSTSLTTNSSTAVDVIALPDPGSVIQLKSLSVFNADTAPIVLTIQKDVSGTPTILHTLTLAVGYKFSILGDECAVFDSTGATVTGASSTFLDLSDTPDSYTGHALKEVRVNAGETGLEFHTLTTADVPDSSNKRYVTDAELAVLAVTSGTNTGDVTLTAVGSSPSANGASLSGQVLTLQPADGTHPGLLTAGTQTIAGTKTFSSTISGSINGNAATVTTIPTLSGDVSNSGNVITVKGFPLVRTAVKTANYIAAANDLVACDSTAGGFTVTLPTAPADKTPVAIKHIILGAGNVITYACGGSDVLNKAAGSTSGTLSILAQGVLLEYQASTSIWTIVADDLPLGQLDLRYPVLNSSSVVKANNLHHVYATAPADVAGVVTLDLSADVDIWKLTLTKNITLAYSNVPAAPLGAEKEIIVTQDGTGGWTLTWPSGSKYPDGLVPIQTAAANAKDRYAFYADALPTYTTFRAPNIS